MLNHSRLLCAALPLLVAGTITARGGEAGAAGEIIKVAGTGGGLCLHLGCGSPKRPGLTAELAEKSGMLVHGMALDGESLKRARETIVSKGVAGRAVVEKLNGKGLPYLDDLARVVVVENMGALKAKGVSGEELQRVLSPGGMLCVLTGGKLTSTVKARPETMDEWTHTRHGPDGNLVSEDRVLRFPLGLRWIDGTPFGTGGFGSCASCRAIVLAGGRCFAVSVDDPGIRRGKTQCAFLTARDAYSGLPLWSLDCEGTYNKVQLDWRNSWPLVAKADRVYTRRKDKLVIADAATGEVVAACDTKFTPRRLLLSGGVLLAACWEKMELNDPKDRFENDRIRAVWWPAGSGSLAAFDPQSGKRKWELPVKALTLAASGKTAY
ncbi:MAG: class I SAM-dependent methyltransferase, partial [Planctomycetota bacterium]